MSAWYLDASAAIKLVADEAGSAALREVVARADRLLASVVLLAEVGAFARRVNTDPADLVSRIEGQCDLVTVTADVGRAAATLRPPDVVGDRAVIRALDAIHVATASRYADAIGGLLTYDERQAAAARAVGLTVVSPA